MNFSTFWWLKFTKCSKFWAPEMMKNGICNTSRFSKIDFTQNLSERKIMKFQHCESKPHLYSSIAQNIIDISDFEKVSHFMCSWQHWFSPINLSHPMVSFFLQFSVVAMNSIYRTALHIFYPTWKGCRIRLTYQPLKTFYILASRPVELLKWVLMVNMYLPN